MSDLVERLRQWAKSDGGEIWTEAADHIEKLEAEKKEWEQAAYDQVNELNRKYEALVKRLDNLCDEWELIEAPLCIKAYKRCIRELRALLEADDE